MKEYVKLLKECVSKEEENALFDIFRKIQVLKKHDKLRNMYKDNKS